MLSNELKFKINLHKQYFDKGFSILNVFRYYIAIFGLGSVMGGIPLWITGVLLTSYLVFCYIFGWWWLNHGWFEAEIEVGNRYNLFVREMRKELIGKPNKNKSI